MPIGVETPCRFTVSPLHQASSCLTGVFHIPVPSIEAGQRWTSIIPNAAHFVEGFYLSTDRGAIPLEVTW